MAIYNLESLNEDSSQLRAYKFNKEQNAKDSDRRDELEKEKIQKRNFNRSSKESSEIDNKEKFKKNIEDLKEKDRILSSSKKYNEMKKDRDILASMNVKPSTKNDVSIGYADDATARHIRRQEKKKSIKETCLYILSVIDEI